MAVQRMTPATERVLRILQEAREPVWGLLLMRETGLPSGTIYPMLSRLEEYGWVQTEWSTEPGPGPRRRLYSITAVGQEAVAAVFAERASRPVRPSRSTRPSTA